MIGATNTPKGSTTFSADELLALEAEHSNSIAESIRAIRDRWRAVLANVAHHRLGRAARVLRKVTAECAAGHARAYATTRRAASTRRTRGTTDRRTRGTTDRRTRSATELAAGRTPSGGATGGTAAVAHRSRTPAVAVVIVVEGPGCARGWIGQVVCAGHVTRPEAAAVSDRPVASVGRSATHRGGAGVGRSATNRGGTRGASWSAADRAAVSDHGLTLLIQITLHRDRRAALEVRVGAALIAAREALALGVGSANGSASGAANVRRTSRLSWIRAAGIAAVAVGLPATASEQEQ